MWRKNTIRNPDKENQIKTQPGKRDMQRNREHDETENKEERQTISNPKRNQSTNVGTCFNETTKRYNDKEIKKHSNSKPTTHTGIHQLPSSVHFYTLCSIS